MSKVIDALASRILDLEPQYERFVPVSAGDTFTLVEDQQNASTRRITASHCRLLLDWLKSRNECRPLEAIEPLRLNTYLAEFFISVRKSDETLQLNDVRRQYEPGTLAAMHASFHRYLSAKGYDNIKQSDTFSHSRAVLSAKMKELKQLGKGNKPHASQPFTQEELDLFVQKNVIGTGSFCLRSN